MTLSNSWNLKPSDGYYVTGIRCYSKYCDDMEVVCKKLSTRDSNAATAPVGMWMDKGMYFKSTQRTTTLEVCTEDSKGQQADKSRTTDFSKEVSLSFEIKATSGPPVGTKVETTFGAAYTASSSTSETVAKSILSSSMQSECRTEVISCDDSCWTRLAEQQPGTTSATLWQWVVVQQAVTDPLTNLGTFVLVPEGIEPFCPPGFQVLGDQTLTNCRTGTFSTERRLSAPVVLV